jgi:hypothetical protein
VHVVRPDQPVDGERHHHLQAGQRLRGEHHGGTETGHANGTYSHWNGYKVDIARSTCNDNWIHSAYTYIGLRSDGYPMYEAASGNVYTNEGSRWDTVSYTGGC